MASDDDDQLKHAVEGRLGGTATFAQSVPVTEKFPGSTIWEGVVHVFDLADHPQATRAYAWASPVEGSEAPRVTAVLHIPPIDSPVTAVRAAIIDERRPKNDA